MSVRNLQTLLAQAREHYRQAVAAQREFSDWLINAKSRSPEEVAERCIAAFKKGEPYREMCHAIAASYPADVLARLQEQLKSDAGDERGDA
jgi:DNA-binding protein H-NS